MYVTIRNKKKTKEEEMGACRVCGEIYGPLDLEDGICKNCLEAEDGQTVKKNLQEERRIQKEIVKKYIGKELKAREKFHKDKKKMLAKGYHVVSEVYVPGQYSTLSYILAVLLLFVFLGIFILFYMIIVKPDGTLVVTYEYKEDVKSLDETQKENNSVMSVADEIKKLKTLLDEGILSDEEFYTQKSKILN